MVDAVLRFDSSPGPHLSGTAEFDAVLDDLERKGVVRRGSGVLPHDFLTRTLPRSRKSVVDALLEERREGR
jgi:hypothetical protein